MWADAVVIGLNAFTVGLFVWKLTLVMRAYNRQPRAAELHDVVVGLMLLAGALSLAAASLAFRFDDAESLVVAARVLIPAWRIILIAGGIWLLLHWRRVAPR